MVRNNFIKLPLVPKSKLIIRLIKKKQRRRLYHWILMRYDRPERETANEWRRTSIFKTSFSWCDFYSFCRSSLTSMILKNNFEEFPHAIQIAESTNYTCAFASVTNCQLWKTYYLIYTLLFSRAYHCRSSGFETQHGIESEMRLLAAWRRCGEGNGRRVWRMPPMGRKTRRRDVAQRSGLHEDS